MCQQLEYFWEYHQRVASLVGTRRAKRLVNRVLVLITVSGNDFVNNYFLVPFSARSRQNDMQDYVPFLISEYRKLLAKLYDLGARRVHVTGTGPLGCVPAELAMRSRKRQCAPELCTLASNLCANRDKYAFWDRFHPPERANRIIVQQIMTGSTKYMDPMNLSTILDMESNL